MRKFFSQKSKHKTTSTLTGSSSNTVTPFTKDDELQITSGLTRKCKSQTTPSQSQVLTNSSADLIFEPTINENTSSEQNLNTQFKPDDNEEKSKKLFVVVSGNYSRLMININGMLLFLFLVLSMKNLLLLYGHIFVPFNQTSSTQQKNDTIL